ncbi:MAG: hypothetical protein KBA33_04270 [Cloacibacterium sp.]|nr:hypothetical protein [Cloacibacterium sp.]
MRKILFIFIFTLSHCVFSQQVQAVDSLKTEKEVVAEIEKANATRQLVRYSPTKAGLYSAVLPGLGQYYNKKYWKIPIVWGAIGTGVGIALWNEKQYQRYRSAFIAELNGQTHEFSGIQGIDLKTALGNTQDRMKRQRDYAIAITAGIYILSIVDAVVDAHLYEGRKDPDLAISPAVLHDITGQQNAKAGLAFSYTF